MTPRPRDTSADAWTTQRVILARLEPEARLRVALELSEAVRSIQLTGLLSRHPDWDRRQAVRYLVERQYGVSLPPGTAGGEA